MAVWRNGIASDYDSVRSGDCRFDPCLGHSFSFTNNIFNTSIIFKLELVEDVPVLACVLIVGFQIFFAQLISHIY